jgi:hypothetical protein
MRFFRAVAGKFRKKSEKQIPKLLMYINLKGTRGSKINERVIILVIRTTQVLNP